MLKGILAVLIVMLPYLSHGSVSSDERMVAGVIYAEARGESFKVKQYVATVIFERSGGIITNFAKTCKLSRQFAPPQYGYNNKWREALAIARSMYHKTFLPLTITIGKREFYPDHFYHGEEAPFWARGKKHMQVGRIKFLYLGKYRTP